MISVRLSRTAPSSFASKVLTFGDEGVENLAQVIGHWVLAPPLRLSGCFQRSIVMEHWWTPGEVATLRESIWQQLTLDEDFELGWADSVIRLAVQGKVEVGERDGLLTVRLARHPTS